MGWNWSDFASRNGVCNKVYFYTFFEKILSKIFHKFQTKLIKHGSSEKCMAINKAKDKIVMEPCIEEEPRQMWKMENFNPDRLSPELTAE